MGTRMDEPVIRSTHDGTVHCSLCSSHGADLEWCPGSSGLLCETCCHGLQDGDPGRIVPLIVRTRGTCTPDEAIDACLTCPRRITHEVGTSPGGEEAHIC